MEKASKGISREMGLAKLQLEALEGVFYIRPSVSISPEIVQRLLNSVKIVYR